MSDSGMSASSRVWVYMALGALCGHVGIMLGQIGNWFASGWLLMLSGGFFAALMIQLAENFAERRRKDADPKERD
jgi:purine-cytosine permease-like protein